MKRPKEYLSKWSGKQFIHGPRILEPNKFSKIYVVPSSWVKERRKGIVNYSQIRHSPKNNVRIKIGILKKGVHTDFGKRGRVTKKPSLAIQSFMKKK